MAYLIELYSVLFLTEEYEECIATYYKAKKMCDEVKED